MTTILTGQLGELLQNTIDKVQMDKPVESDWPKFCKRERMTQAFLTIQNWGTQGLAGIVKEGQTFPSLSIARGATTQFRPIKLALQMSISSEAVEDGKWKEIVDLVRHLKRAMTRSKDYLAHEMLVYAWSKIGGDGQPLFSTSHPLPGGGTYANMSSTPLTPSRVAVALTRSAIRKMPDNSGLMNGPDPVAIICPEEQEYVWQGILESDKAPEPGAFNEINVVKRYKLKLIPLRLWSNTTTNWCMTTDAEGGFTCYQRTNQSPTSWLTNSNQTKFHALSERFVFGYSDPRCAWGHQA